MKILDQNKPLGLTLNDILEDTLLIGCADGAVHDITKPKNDGVINYFINLVSRVLIEKLGVRPSLKK